MTSVRSATLATNWGGPGQEQASEHKQDIWVRGDFIHAYSQPNLTGVELDRDPLLPTSKSPCKGSRYSHHHSLSDLNYLVSGTPTLG